MVAAARFDEWSGADRLPPYNPEVEEAVLGALLIDGRAIARVASDLTPDMFYLSGHQELYRAILALFADRQPIDLTTVAMWLRDHGTLERVGGQSRIAQLADRAVTSANVDVHASLLIDKFTRRQLIQCAREAEYLAHDTGTPLEAILDASAQKFYNLSHRRADSELTSAGDLAIALMDRIESGRSPGIATGFYDLDSMTAGLQPGALVTVAGATGVGKTHFALALSLAIARLHGLPVVFFSCEMSREELGFRVLASLSGIESRRIADGRLSEQEWERLNLAIAEFAQMPIHIYEAANPGLAEMRSVIRRVNDTAGLGLVVLDYLQLLGSSSDNRVREVDSLARGCKAIAKEFKVPFVSLAQINREVTNRANKRPVLSDLRESGAIEQHSNQVIFLYRDEYYDPGTSDRGIAELIVAKNRSGPAGTVRLLFDPSAGLFRNLQGSRA